MTIIRSITIIAFAMNSTSMAAEPVATPAPAPAAVAPATPTYLTLPANTELTITPNSDLSSKKLKEGDSFMFSTVYDVLMNNQIIIPKGTRGQGKVLWRTGKGAFGKSAKMDLAFQWLDLGGRRIIIEGTHRQEGQGNTAATVGTVLAAGVFGAFVTGKSATVPHGMQLRAFTAEPVQFLATGLSQAPVAAAIVTPQSSGAQQGTSPAVAATSSNDMTQ